MMDQLSLWRKELHQIPEVGLKEYKTTAYLKSELEKMGYHPFSVLETGCVVYIDHQSDKTIAFRSDIDGLEIQEHSDYPYPSIHEGMMHACGHDGHMTMLLGLAQQLIHQECDYNILLIFQPAEEYPGGAKLIVESGILEKYNVKAIFGFHLMPTIDQGVVACKSGPLMAMCGELDVNIKGKNSHAGMPQNGIDSLMIATQLLNQYHGIVTRTISPLENAIIHIGSMKAGDTRNSVASHAEIHGTVRTYSEQTFKHIQTMVKAMSHQMEEIYGCEIETKLDPMYPPVLNDDSLYKKVASIVDIQELKEPLMLAEDFSFYQKAVPGLFMFLGTKTDKYQSPLHADTFNYPNKLLQTGIDTYLSIIKNIKL